MNICGKKNLVFCRSFYQDKYLFPRVVFSDDAEEVSGVKTISQSTVDINYLQHSAPMFQHDLNLRSNYAKIRFDHPIEVLVFHSRSLTMMTNDRLQWLCDTMKTKSINIGHSHWHKKKNLLLEDFSPSWEQLRIRKILLETKYFSKNHFEELLTSWANLYY